jgi:hypothetical protein
MIFAGFMCHHQWKKIWKGFVPDNPDSFKMNKIIYYKCHKCGKIKTNKSLAL